MSISKLQKPILGVAIISALLLLAPALAMQFTPEVSWGPGDFVVAAVLLFGAGALAVLGLSHFKGNGAKVAFVIAIAFSVAVVWAELAIGLFR